MDKNRTIIVTAIATFIIGLLMGYSTWGVNQGKDADAKQLLTQAIQAIEKIEKENRNLKIDLKIAKRDKLKKENQELKNQLKKYQQDNRKLKGEIASLKAQLAKAEAKLKSSGEFRKLIDSMKKRIEELEKESHNLKLILGKMSSLTEQQNKGHTAQSREKTAVTQDEGQQK